ncbi:MAG TPA: 16S rRNA (guanine(527)-N(7))-methyltransferase RsmG [Candidatus Dormibacteraeota bacterium]
MRPEIQRYAEMLLDWNRTVNLTGARTMDEVLAQIAAGDALRAVPWTGIGRVIDIGSGGGLPAVPMAIAMPKVHFTLLEANTRKCAFLIQVSAALKLTNLAVAAGRAEELGHQPSLREQFDRAISRAAAPPAVLLELALPFVRPGGDLVAQVSPVDPQLLEPAARLLGGGPPRLEHPGDGAGTLLVVPKLGPTPAGFPRRTGLPNRKPLA